MAQPEWRRTFGKWPVEYPVVLIHGDHVAYFLRSSILPLSQQGSPRWSSMQEPIVWGGCGACGKVALSPDELSFRRIGDDGREVPAREEMKRQGAFGFFDGVAVVDTDGVPTANCFENGHRSLVWRPLGTGGIEPRWRLTCSACGEGFNTEDRRPFAYTNTMCPVVVNIAGQYMSRHT